MQAYRILLILVILIIVFGCAPHQSTFYVDHLTGNDANPGTQAKPFKTIEKVNAISIKTGYSVLFAGGQTFEGNLIFKCLVGTREQPILIGSFGNGRATINGGLGNSVWADSCSWLQIENLLVIGDGRLKGNKGSGIELRHSQDCTMDSLEASGFLWSGIKALGGNNLKITNVYAHDNGFSGINVESDGQDAGGLEGSGGKTFRDVYIANCVAENNPGCPVVKNNHSGNGILIGGVTNGLIEYCEAMNNGWDMPRDGNGPVGIWAYQSDSITIQYCYSHHNKTSEKGKDGGGFDFDGGITNSVMQYNYSAHNEGAGYGIFQYGGATVWMNNTIRYNTSYNDGSKNGKCGILMWCDPSAVPMKGFNAYQNTIVNNQGYCVNFEPGNYSDFIFENNSFLLMVPSDRFVGGTFKGAKFRKNFYWTDQPKEPKKI